MVTSGHGSADRGDAKAAKSHDSQDRSQRQGEGRAAESKLRDEAHQSPAFSQKMESLAKASPKEEVKAFAATAKTQEASTADRTALSKVDLASFSKTIKEHVTDDQFSTMRQAMQLVKDGTAPAGIARQAMVVADIMKRMQDVKADAAVQEQLKRRSN